MPSIDYSPIIERLEKATRELVDAVNFDVNGAMIGNQWRGGNGGLVSRETLIKVDEASRALDAAASFRSLSEQGGA